MYQIIFEVLYEQINHGGDATTIFTYWSSNLQGAEWEGFLHI